MNQESLVDEITKEKLRREIEEEMAVSAEKREEMLRQYDSRIRALAFLAFTALCVGIPTLALVAGFSVRLFFMARGN